MTFSSWTYDQKGIDYFSFSDRIGTSSYLENEGWYVLTTKGTVFFPHKHAYAHAEADQNS